MGEVLPQMVGGDHEPSDLVRGYVLVDPRTSTETALSSKVRLSLVRTYRISLALIFGDSPPP
jgi:hypothetical protein